MDVESESDESTTTGDDYLDDEVDEEDDDANSILSDYDADDIKIVPVTSMSFAETIASKCTDVCKECAEFPCAHIALLLLNVTPSGLAWLIEQFKSSEGADTPQMQLVRKHLYELLRDRLWLTESPYHPLSLARIMTPRLEDDRMTECMRKIADSADLGLAWLLTGCSMSERRCFSFLVDEVQKTPTLFEEDMMARTVSGVCGLKDAPLLERMIQMLTVLSPESRNTMILLLLWEIYCAHWDNGFTTLLTIPDLDTEIKQTKGLAQKLMVSHGCICNTKMNEYLTTLLPVPRKRIMIAETCAFCETAKIAEPRKKRRTRKVEIE